MADIVSLGMGFIYGNIDKTLPMVGAANVKYIKESISDFYPPASAPNTPPHQRTGKLYDGVTFTVDEEMSSVEISSTRVGTMVPGWLEFGTTKIGGGGMAPRPYMTPARQESRKISKAAIAYGMSAATATAAYDSFINSRDILGYQGN